MTTSAVSLIEQVRSRLLDYGNGAVTLAAAVSDTTSTTISLSAITDVMPRQFLLIDSELLEITAKFDGTPPTVTVIRGARGSTAATHTSGAVVRIDPVYGQHECLRFLNQALDASFPSLYSVADLHHCHSGTAQATGNTTTALHLAATASTANDYYNNMTVYFTGGTGSGQTAIISDYVGSTQIATIATVTLAADSTTTYEIGKSVASNTWEYDLPENCNMLARVEIETSTSGVFELNRGWNYQDHNTIVLKDASNYSVGRAIRFVGYAKFDAMTVSGNLDTDFPDSNATAVEYLVVKAVAHALRGRQAPIARRDSFLGITDSFQAAQPFMSTLSAKDYEQQAKSLLKQCRMVRLPEYLPDGISDYYCRG